MNKNKKIWPHFNCTICSFNCQLQISRSSTQKIITKLTCLPTWYGWSGIIKEIELTRCSDNQKSMDSTLRTETHLMNFTIRHCRAAEELLKINKIIQTMYVTFFNTIFVSRYVPREPQRDQSNRRLNEHGIYIRHCHESNSQPVLSQVQADPTRPQ